MSLTKKHYKEIVKILREASLNGFDQEQSYRTAKEIVENLSDFFIRDNPNFNREKFLEAFENGL
jgi:hypothetical protein